MATVIESWSLRVKSSRNFDSWPCPRTSAPSQELEPPPYSPDLVLPMSSRSRGCKQRLRLPNKMRQKTKKNRHKMSSESILNRYMYDGASVFSQKKSSFKGNRIISVHLRLTNLFKQMPRNVRKSRKFCTPVIVTVCSPGPSDRREWRVCCVAGCGVAALRGHELCGLPHRLPGARPHRRTARPIPHEMTSREQIFHSNTVITDEISRLIPPTRDATERPPMQ